MRRQGVLPSLDPNLLLFQYHHHWQVSQKRREEVTNKLRSYFQSQRIIHEQRMRQRLLKIFQMSLSFPWRHLRWSLSSCISPLMILTKKLFCNRKTNKYEKWDRDGSCLWSLYSPLYSLPSSLFTRLQSIFHLYGSSSKDRAADFSSVFHSTLHLLRSFLYIILVIIVLSSQSFSFFLSFFLTDFKWRVEWKAEDSAALSIAVFTSLSIPWKVFYFKKTNMKMATTKGIKSKRTEAMIGQKLNFQSLQPIVSLPLLWIGMNEWRWNKCIFNCFEGKEHHMMDDQEK